DRELAVGDPTSELAFGRVRRAVLPKVDDVSNDRKIVDPEDMRAVGEWHVRRRRIAGPAPELERLAGAWAGRAIGLDLRASAVEQLDDQHIFTVGEQRRVPILVKLARQPRVGLRP